VQVSYDEGVAIHIGPESCAVAREGFGEALGRGSHFKTRRPPRLNLDSVLISIY
jgi:hypothetical protein